MIMFAGFIFAVCLVAVEASKPHSVSIVVTPVHHYAHDPNTEALFHPILSLPDTPVPSLTLKATPTTIYRPRYPGDLRPMPWDPIDVLGPDVEDRHTLSQLARISGNAYALPGQKNWYDIDSAWNIVSHNLPSVFIFNHACPRAFLLAGKIVP